ncbi:hypothetical protein RK21_00705 [Pseudomonas plecoglossicida]|nr:hypothetical protein RK21_00705 [Pseudomonas plecoglossicida]
MLASSPASQLLQVLTGLEAYAVEVGAGLPAKRPAQAKTLT